MKPVNRNYLTWGRHSICAGWLLLAAGLAGCNSVGWFDSSTPQVRGRVLDAETRQPLAGVQVIRLKPGQSLDAGSPPFGAQLLMQGRPELSAANGSFCLPGAKYMTFLKPSGQWTVRMAFQASQYVTLQTNFMETPATKRNIHSFTGSPVMNVGDVLLHPKL